MPFILDLQLPTHSRMQSFHPGANLATAHRTSNSLHGIWLCSFISGVQSSWVLLRGKKSPCWVFTLGTSSWREVKTPPFNVYLGTAPFLHQALHFLTCISDGVKETNHIAVFDINTEEYREAISLPEFSHGGTAVTFRFLRLTKLGGCLCLTFDLRELREPLEVWLLKDYCNGEWIKRYTIHVISAYPTPCFIFGAYLTDTMGDVSILLNCSDEDGVKLLCYDPQDGTATLKKDKEWGATFYVESFYPLLSR